MGDYGAARIAARKAREAAPSDPRPWVVSAWIELAEDNNKQAKAYADEALIADEDKDAVVDIQEVRGVAFEALREWNKAANCYRQAIRRASDTYKSQLYLRLVRAFSFNNKATIDLCLEALVDNLTPDARRSIDGIIKSSIKSWAGCRHDYEDHGYKGWNIKELTERIEQLNKLASQVGSLNLPVDNKRDLVSYINFCAQILDLFRFAKTLRDQPSPSEPFVGDMQFLFFIPLPGALALAAICFLLGLPNLQHYLQAAVLIIIYIACRYLWIYLRERPYKQDQVKARAAEKASDELLERLRNY